MDILKKHVDMLGLKVKDRVTGFAGVISSISFDLFGCVQAVVTPAVDEKGEAKDSKWFDVNRLSIVGDHVMPVPDFKHLATPEGLHEKGAADKPPR